MNQIAYVVCWFEIVAGAPVFKGAGIYSENAGQLTCQSSVVPMDVFRAYGKDYEDAYANALDMCKQYRHVGWLLPHLKNQIGVRGVK